MLSSVALFQSKSGILSGLRASLVLQANALSLGRYKARHAHKRLYTVLPKYSKNPSSPWYHQLQIGERQ